MTMVKLWLHLKNRRKRRKPQSVWVRPYLTCCASHGHHENLVCELTEDLFYRDFIRLDADLFNQIVEREYNPTLRNQERSGRSRVAGGEGTFT